MRTVFTVAVGLAATASAAGLRRNTKAEALDRSLKNGLEALAEKYDCTTGGKGLEKIISEITADNQKASSKLESDCTRDLTAIQANRDKSDGRANFIVKQAPITGKKQRDLDDDRANKRHDAVELKHKKNVDEKSTAETTAKNSHSSETKDWMKASNQYDNEKRSIFNSRNKESTRYSTSMKKAKDDLGNGRVAETKVQNDVKTQAAEDKTIDDRICKSDYTARTKIVESDTQIVERLKALNGELGEIRSDDDWTPPVKCLPPNTSGADAGYGDAYRGWYDVQGCGTCNDYCRWVGNSRSGGDPANKVIHHRSWWSCRKAGGGTESHYTKFVKGSRYYGKDWKINGVSPKKCSGKGAAAPTTAAPTTAAPTTVSCDSFTNYQTTCTAAETADGKWDESFTTPLPVSCVFSVPTHGTSCATYCQSQGSTCVRGQDNKRGCNLDTNHHRQTQANNGCDQKWSTQVCACAPKTIAPAAADWQSNKWCNGVKTMVTGMQAKSYGGREQCIEQCRGNDACSWVGYRVADQYCEFWTAGSCNPAHSQPGHDILNMESAADKAAAEKYDIKVGRGCKGRNEIPAGALSQHDKSTKTREQCMAKCDSMANCVSFEAYSDGKNGIGGCQFSTTCRNNLARNYGHIQLYVKKVATSLLEVRDRVQGDYDDLLEKKSSEITSFDTTCKGAIADYDGELARAHAASKLIRDTTDTKHGNIYKNIKETEEGRVDRIKLEHKTTVAAKKKASDSAQSEYQDAHKTFMENKDTYEVEKDAVTAERASTKQEAKDNRAEIRQTRDDTNEKATSAFEATMNQATSTRTSELTQCKENEEKRLGLLKGDESVINQLAPLINKLEACKGTKATGTKVKATMGSKTTIGGGAGCTGTKAPGRPNICLWDSKRCVDRYGQCGILESKALQVCADWDECGGVVCRSAYRGYCLARKKINGRTKNKYWAYKKSGRDGSGNVILLEETTSKSARSLVAAEMVTAAACALNEEQLEATFLEAKAMAPSTTGSFNDWKKRLVDEKKEASKNRKECDAGANKVYDDVEDKALALKKKTIDDSNSRASTDTTNEDDAENTANIKYNNRMTAVKGPYDDSEDVSNKAEGKRDSAKKNHEDAMEDQDREVSKETTNMEKVVSDANSIRTDNIAKDMAFAKDKDDTAEAKHLRLTTKKNQECERESMLLSEEKTRLEKITIELNSLKMAGEGLDRNDASKTIAEDIEYLERKIDQETQRKTDDQDSCLVNSKKDESDLNDKAQVAYDDADVILVRQNKDATDKATATNDVEVARNNQRDAANKNMREVAKGEHDDTQADLNAASQALRVAEKLEHDSVDSSETTRRRDLKAAETREERFVADQNDQAKGIKDDAKLEFVTQNKEKNGQCSDQRTILKDEKEVLGATSAKIGELQVVDNTAADNTAAAEKAAADKVAAEKAAAEKAAAEKAAAEKAAADKAAAEKAAADKAAADKAAAEKAAAEKTFFHHPAEMACKSGGSWKRPYGNVKSTKAGFESCGSQCKAGGFKYFGLECPMRGPRGDKGKVHCQCSSDLSSSNKIDPKQCSGARNLGHCNGPFVTEGGYSLGAHSYGSVYSVASYYITEVNQNCGVTGNVITSKEECAFALKKVGKSDRFVWNGVYSGIPGGCSVRGSADGHYDNRGLQGTVGEQRGDLRAVCKRFGESKSFGAPYSVWPNHPSATKVGANGIPLSWCTERQNKPFNQGGPRVKGGNFGGGKATWCIAAKK